MEKSKGHCLIMPDQLQGHINPMLQFSKRLAQKGVKITLAVTRYTFKTMQDFSCGSISVETISDGYDDGWRGDLNDDLQEFVDRTRQVGTKTMEELLERLRGSGRQVDCVVYDPLIPWCLDVAKKLGLVGVAFFTQSCVVTSIYHHLYEGRIRLPFSDGGAVRLAGLPAMEPSDMPSFMYDGSYPSGLKLMLDQFENIAEADCILVNSFYELETEAVEWMAGMGKVRTIGPSIPSAYMDKRMADDRVYGLSMLKPSKDTCVEWLGRRAPRSVIYVSFGSMAELGAEQMGELADGLRLSGYYFMWVVRPTEESKLPDGFSSEKGLVVGWCPQLEVLADEAVGCFVTHCGWNSMLEALSLGVPMVGMPQWSDQTTNSKLMVDVWGVGIRAHPNQRGVVGGAEIVRCVKHVMEDGGGEEMRRSAERWKRLAREAVDAGGTSDQNIEEFVASMVASAY
ncbi:mogroside IE synthase-like [Salvia splendens]|uniref:mogroside IE synthase-like n=1 Tax=Salvia splendens TaxID=180675 RepID=UPI001C266539|nr:mogroside IE synthase-like [Salvia splendens]